MDGRTDGQADLTACLSPGPIHPSCMPRSERGSGSEGGRDSGVSKRESQGSPEIHLSFSSPLSRLLTPSLPLTASFAAFFPSFRASEVVKGKRGILDFHLHLSLSLSLPLSSLSVLPPGRPLHLRQRRRKDGKRS